VKYNIKLLFTSFLFALLFSIPSQSRERDRIECKSPTMEFICQLTPPPNYSVQQKFESIEEECSLWVYYPARSLFFKRELYRFM